MVQLKHYQSVVSQLLLGLLNEQPQSARLSVLTARGLLLSRPTCPASLGWAAMILGTVVTVVIICDDIHKGLALGTGRGEEANSKVYIFIC